MRTAHATSTVVVRQSAEICPGRRARLQSALGSTCYSLGLAAEAIDLLEKTRDYYRSVPGLERERKEALGSLGNLAIAYAAADRHDDALRTGQEVLAASMEVFGPEHPDTLKGRTHLAGFCFNSGRREEALKMLEEIGDVSKVGEFIKKVKDKSSHVRLMGFGHRVYKNHDPRAKIIKKMADQVFEVTGRNPLLDIALELERIALEDEYFVKRRLYPNVDFYSGLIYQAMKFPTEMFCVLFAIPRMSGWLAQWQEMLEDKDQKIARPRQIFLGPARRDYVPLHRRA